MVREESPYIDAEQQQVRPAPSDIEVPRKQYLAASDGVSLRPEATTTKGRAKTWDAVTDEFRQYIWRQWKAANTVERERGYRPDSHSYSYQAAVDKRVRALGVDRAVARLFDNPSTILVTRRANPFGVNGRPQPPAELLADLMRSSGNVYSAYRRHLREKGQPFARLTVLEPLRNGYVHVHDGLWTEGDVSPEQIRPAVAAHVRHVPQADPDNHGDGAVSIRNDPDRRHHPDDPEGVPPTTALPRELTKHLGGFAPFRDDDGHIPERKPDVPNVLQAENGRVRSFALLWARGGSVRQYRPDQMDRESDHHGFNHLVTLSQELFGDAADADKPIPEDLRDGDGPRDGGIELVGVDARPTSFTREAHGEPPDEWSGRGNGGRL